MRLKQILFSTVATIGIAALSASAPVSAQPKKPASLTPAAATTAVAIDADDIGGTVRGSKGPEAGVWVIAETTDLPTRSPEASSPTTRAAT